MQEEQPSDHQFRYNLLDFSDPFAAEAFKNGVDPTNKITKVQIEFQDPSIREFYKKHILKEFSQINNLGQVYSTLINFYQNLKKTGVYKKVNVTFAPGDEEDTLKVIYTPEKARRFNISAQNEIDKSGAVLLETKADYRNVFGLLDNISFEGSKGFGGQASSSYTFKYNLPILYKDFSLQLLFEKCTRQITKNILENSVGQAVTISNDNSYLRLSNSDRNNYIDPINHSREILDNEILPSRKTSIKYGRIWDSIYEIDQEYGNHTEASAELALGKTNFLKLDFLNHTFINPKSFEYKKKIRQINFENMFGIGLLLPLTKQKLRLNDRFYTYSLRGFDETGNKDFLWDKRLHPYAGNPGFEYLGDYIGDDIYIKDTFKINFNSYPYLRQVKITPFLYMSMAYLSGDFWGRSGKIKRTLSQELKENVRLSTGVGLNWSMGPAKLEILLNLASRGKASDKGTRLQWRLSIHD